MREWLARLHDWFRRDRLDRELGEELQLHREHLERDARAEGVGAEEAVFAARRRLGQVTRYQEEARDRWSWPWLDHLRQDLRYAFRGLRRSPGFTTTVILTLGLGIGANAAMFGIIDRLMFRPFPYLRDPGAVHRVYLQWHDRGQRQLPTTYQYTRYLDLLKWTTGFSQLAVVSHGRLAVGLGDVARERQIARVSASFFDFFDARPTLGRFFVAAEDATPMGAPVVVLSHAFWQSEYGGDDVVGKALQVGNVMSTIIGVAPPGFVGVGEPDPAVFMPITTYAGSVSLPNDPSAYFTRYDLGWVNVIARRRPGVSVEEASADLSRAYLLSWNAERLIDPEVTPPELARPTAMAGPLKAAAGPLAGLESKTLRWVMGVAVIVLLIACANVTNLMFARVLRRQREIAVRLALGVSRGRLLAQALTESLLLAALGCLTGLAVAQWGGAALRRLYLPSVSSLDVFTDWRTLGAATALALAAGLITALGPAWLATHSDLATTLKAGAREGTYHRSRTRSALLILQGALSVVLLIGAGLFVRSLNNVRQMRLGYDAEPVLMASQSLRGLRLNDSARVALGRRLLEAARTVPGVERSTWVSSIPFWSTSTTAFFVPGVDSVRHLGRFTYQLSTPGYFATMGTRIVRGRAYDESDRAEAPRVVVVSEAMAGALWPGQDPIGKCMRIGADTMPCSTVIGVAEDAVQNSLTDDQRFRYYLPLDQFRPANGHTLLLRMRGSPIQQVEGVRRALQRVMPGQSYITVRPLDELLAGQRRSWQLGATMFVAFGFLALLVAAVGLYGVITYNVAQRMHELGVRIALGARSSHLVRLVVGQGVRFAVAGVTLGLGAALLGARWIQPLLFRQSATDPATYGVVAGLLLLVACAACVVPAVRATRADPNSALRSD
ncbi:MAG: ABC transporter permease [Gemmatimonadales bacterium]|nr:ABC transporter permease [Gemmatimonadales bacterium]